MLEREYPNHRFDTETVRLAYDLFKRFVAGQVPEERQSKLLLSGEWKRLNEADDFFDAYAPDAQSAELTVIYKTSSFLFSFDGTGTRVEVGLPNLADATRVVEFFDLASTDTDSRSSVFIGHGRDPAWMSLAHHLDSQPDLRVLTYENSIGAGVTAIELLEQLALDIDFAVLVHTRDGAPTTDGRVRSANVVHETGFFQGALGRHRTLVVRERGSSPFHNIAGLHEVTFGPESIEEAFDHVLRIVRRALLPRH
jgi:predicted nucleotide-binding protein